jgi:hypothetical protein
LPNLPREENIAKTSGKLGHFPYLPESYFVSKASVYRLLKAHDLIASPAFIVMKAADEFNDTESGWPKSTNGRRGCAAH